MTPPDAYPEPDRIPAQADRPAPPGTCLLRLPTLEDGPALWELVRGSSLDDNSPYAYLMLSRYFAGTCVVAEQDGDVTGLLAAFIAPAQPQTLFVWQVGTRPVARGQGLARRMVLEALRRPACNGVRYVEATVTPSNAASLALFRGLARRLGTHCIETPCFPEHLFPTDGHEAERLLRIGPFDSAALAATTFAKD